MMSDFQKKCSAVSSISVRQYYLLICIYHRYIGIISISTNIQKEMVVYKYFTGCLLVFFDPVACLQIQHAQSNISIHVELCFWPPDLM